jgi:hypothetical protein
MTKARFTSSSYKTAICCYGVNCYHIDDSTENEPCWGAVGVVDEVSYGEDDYGWVHGCEGHAECWGGGDYIKEQPELQRANKLLE